MTRQRQIRDGVMRALSKAEDRANGRAALAARLGVAYSTIGMWHQRRSIPAEHLEAIETATRGQVTVYDLLADMRAARERRTP